MAYIDKDKDGKSWYNVNFAVGYQGVNKRDDVMLVQWMLHRLYKDRGHQPVGGKPMVIDGWIGPQTVTWILDFQSRMQGNKHACHYDGTVDSARKTVASVTKTIYTIIWMNAYLRKTSPKAAVNPDSDPDCPAELRMALKRNTDAAGPFAPYQQPFPATGGI